MATILLRVPLDAKPGDVYEALATSKGVNGWWSNHTEGPEGVGSSIKVAFPDAPMTFDFEVVEEVAGERVAWRCLAGPPEWIGTTISYDIQTKEGETSVLFAHHDRSVVSVHRLLLGADIAPAQEARRNGQERPLLRFLIDQCRRNRVERI
jgi:uncharacterized protein YndB with AHSA1/START domain